MKLLPGQEEIVCEMLHLSYLDLEGRHTLKSLSHMQRFALYNWNRVSLYGCLTLHPLREAENLGSGRNGPQWSPCSCVTGQ